MAIFDNSKDLDRKLTFIQKDVSCIRNSLAAGASNFSATASDITEATIGDTATVSAGTFTAGENMRSVEVQSRAASDAKLEITITKTDGSVLTFRTFTSGSWNYEGNLNEAPISDITVENVTGSAVDVEVIINTVSRS